MPPTGGDTGRRNSSLNAQLWNWNNRTGLGEVFDSSTAFRLPNGADRSPDSAWISLDVWSALTEEQQEKFPPVCPDFVVEIRSRTDRLSPLQAKMQEYMNNGARLGWLINKQDKQVEIYKPGKDVEILDNPSQLSGDPTLPGFRIKLAGIL